MDPIFPILSSPLTEGRSQSLEDNVLRRQNDTGPPELRRITSQIREPRTLAYLVTDAEKAAFLDWFRDDLAQGAKTFEITLDGVALRAQMSDVPGLSPVGPGGWRITLQILTLGEVT